MRWDSTKGPRWGSRRTIEVFLVFPKCLPNYAQTKHEWRWLEKASIIQEWDTGYDNDILGWRDVSWASWCA